MVARLGSMREAASRLNVTQPAVTQALKALEDHVGAPLLDRSTRPAGLTEAGRQLARATHDGIDLIATTIEDIRFQAGVSDQALTVACTLGMATYWLMPRLPDFYAEQPGAIVNVQAPPTDLPAILPGIDIALRYGSGNWSDGETVKLFEEIVCPVGRPALIERILAQGGGLDTAPLIHVRGPADGHWAGWREYFKACGRSRPAGRGETFDNYVQAVQATLDGRGLMLGWRSITATLVSEGNLAPWPDGEIDIGTGYFATLSPRRSSALAETFLAWLARTVEAER